MAEQGPDGNLNAGMGDEFMVAADLTLYGNPLRCLTTRKKKQDSKPEAETTSANSKASSSDSGGDGKKAGQKEAKNERKSTNAEKSAAGQQKHSVDGNATVDTIAADLTKYSSPLDDKI